MTTMPKHIAIFASGSGSNAENIIRHINRPQSKGLVKLVISNRSDAGVLQRAKDLGVDSIIVDKDKLNDSDYMLRLLEKHRIEIAVLAGFLLMIPPFLIHRFEGRMVNIHPSLLPKFGGKGMFGRHVHEAVLKSGETESGITIHLVNEEYDRGQILLQASCPVKPTDTADSLEKRIRELEAKHFARVVESLL